MVPKSVFVLAAVLWVIFMGAHWSWAGKVGWAELLNARGESVGVATFVEVEQGVKLMVQVYGLPSGAHGIHIHGVGEYSPPVLL